MIIYENYVVPIKDSNNIIDTFLSNTNEEIFDYKFKHTHLNANMSNLLDGGMCSKYISILRELRYLFPSVTDFFMDRLIMISSKKSKNLFSIDDIVSFFKELDRDCIISSLNSNWSIMSISNYPVIGIYNYESNEMSYSIIFIPREKPSYSLLPLENNYIVHDVLKFIDDKFYSVIKDYLIAKKEVMYLK